jgi:SOS response regulatory protein OraA/RecX
LRLLRRRPLTREELRSALEDRGYDSVDNERVLRALADEGWLDDHALAVHYIVVRAERLGHGRDRLLNELVERGVAAATAAGAWSEALEQGRLEPSRMLARQVDVRLRREGGRLGPHAYRRVYNSLLRAGFDAASVSAQLEPYRDFPDDGEGVVVDE